MSSKICIFFMILFTIPSLIVHPCSDIPLTKPSSALNSNEPYKESYSRDYHSYVNELLQVIKDIDELDDLELEDKYTPHELEKISHLLAFIARKGLRSDESEEELENDIAQLLNTQSNSWEYASYLPNNEVQAIPSIFYGNANVIPCKSWFEKQCKHIKKFYKKNKTPILIGTGAVVATVVVVCIVVGTGGTAAPAVDAGAAGLSGASATLPLSEKPTVVENKKENLNGNLKEYPDFVEHLKITPTAIEEHISSLKEITPHDNFFYDSNNSNNQVSYSEEHTKLAASFLAHESLEQIYFPS